MVWICLIAQFLDSALPHSPEFIEYTPRKKSAGKRKHLPYDTVLKARGGALPGRALEVFTLF